jgi:hypothetical protein
MERLYFWLMVASVASSGVLMILASSVPLWSHPLEAWMRRRAEAVAARPPPRLASGGAGSSVGVPS